MKHSIVVLALIFCAFGSRAQAPAATTAGNDSTLAIQLNDVQVRSRFKNDTERYHYNQMKFYVTTVLPYVNVATKTFNEINAEVEKDGISKRERKAYINTKEDEVRSQFEDKVLALNVTQGALLVKLIQRQTGLNIYDMLKEFKNPLTAMKWQAWSRVHGMNLNRKYDPAEEHDLEMIMYELGYPLPASYNSVAQM